MPIDAAPSLPSCRSFSHLRHGGPAEVRDEWTHRTSGEAAVDHHGRGQESSTPQGGLKAVSKPIQLNISRFGFQMRILCRKSIVKMSHSSKDIREKLMFFSNGSRIESFWNLVFNLVSKKKLLKVSNFSESFIKIDAVVSEI